MLVCVYCMHQQKASSHLRVKALTPTLSSVCKNTGHHIIKCPPFQVHHRKSIQGPAWRTEQRVNCCYSKSMPKLDAKAHNKKKKPTAALTHERNTLLRQTGQRRSPGNRGRRRHLGKQTGRATTNQVHDSTDQRFQWVNGHRLTLVPHPQLLPFIYNRWQITHILRDFQGVQAYRSNCLDSHGHPITQFY